MLMAIFWITALSARLLRPITVKVEKAAWPKTLPDQIAAVREALSELGKATLVEVASRFKHARGTTVEPLLASLEALGQAELIEDGRYAA